MFNPESIYDPKLKTKFKSANMNVGVGSLTSYYEAGVGSQTSSTLPELSNFTKGPMSLFPQLDVMPGAASAFNEAYVHNWGLDKYTKLKFDVDEHLHQEALGELRGLRLHNNVEFKDEKTSKSKMTEGTFSFTNDNIDMHAGQAPHGRHVLSESIFNQSKELGTQHAMGDAQMARKRGLNRGKNPAINGSTGEEAFHNTEVIKDDEDVVTPMETDVIHINEEEIRVEDTAQMLDGNV